MTPPSSQSSAAKARPIIRAGSASWIRGPQPPKRTPPIPAVRMPTAPIRAENIRPSAPDPRSTHETRPHCDGGPRHALLPFWAWGCWPGQWAWAGSTSSSGTRATSRRKRTGSKSARPPSRPPGWTSWWEEGCRTSFLPTARAASCSAAPQPLRARRSSSASPRRRTQAGTSTASRDQRSGPLNCGPSGWSTTKCPAPGRPPVPRPKASGPRPPKAPARRNSGGTSGPAAGPSW